MPIASRQNHAIRLLFSVLLLLSKSIFAYDSSLIKLEFSMTSKDFEGVDKIFCKLKFTNLASDPISLPDLNCIKAKAATPGVYYLNQRGILTCRISSENGDLISPSESRTSRFDDEVVPIITLTPGESSIFQFRLRAIFPDTLSHGRYHITVILNTNLLKQNNIAKGVYYSQEIELQILKIPTFREKRDNETTIFYEEEKTNFYLNRISAYQGNYIENIEKILAIEAGVPALIKAAFGGNKNINWVAKGILCAIHHPCSGHTANELPKKEEEWLSWWQSVGSQIEKKVLLGNACSYMQ